MKITRPNIGRLLFVAAFLSLALVVTVAGWLYTSKAYTLRRAQIDFQENQWKEWGSDNQEEEIVQPSIRQRMLSDLVENYLPGSDKTAIENILGVSPTHNEMKRQTIPGMEHKYKPEGHYFDENGWDLLYVIGIADQGFVSKRLGLSGDFEYLLIRLDSNGEFESWYVVGGQGNEWWPRVVARKSAATFQKHR